MNIRPRIITALALLALTPAVMAQGTYMGDAEVVRVVPGVQPSYGTPPQPQYGAPPPGSYGQPSYPPPNYPAPPNSGQPDYGPPPGAYGQPTYAPQGYGSPLPTQMGAPFAQEELDGLLAPIALYPDQLLAQILMASTFPLDVVEAARLVQQNPNLQGQALDDALAARNWDPSVLSLAGFPQVLLMMNDRIDWTRRLGEAFLTDQNRVMQTVQDLRQRAQSTGNLVNTPQQRVIVENRVVYIEPTQPQVVYVPYYNPVVVYGPWWAPAYTPFYWRPPARYYSGAVITTGVVAFGVGYRVTSNHWGWARPDWRARQIAIEQHRNYFIERRPYYRDWVRDGHWQHRGENYRDSRNGRPVARPAQHGGPENRPANRVDRPREAPRYQQQSFAPRQDGVRPEQGPRPEQRENSPQRAAGEGNAVARQGNAAAASAPAGVPRADAAPPARPLREGGPAHAGKGEGARTGRPREHGEHGGHGAQHGGVNQGRGERPAEQH